MNEKDKQLQRPEVSEFLDTLAKTPKSRKSGTAKLLFGLDATASREMTWDHASHIQGDMFQAALALGGLQIQVCYYRGFSEFDHSAWCENEQELAGFMRKVSCLGGYTQIERILLHALDEAKHGGVKAVVFVGDCMEEDPDKLCHLAGKLALYNVPIFCFQEGNDYPAKIVLRSMAELTHGAYCAFETGSAEQLRNLLTAVSVYASGGYAALQDFNAKFDKPVLLLPATIK